MGRLMSKVLVGRPLFHRLPYWEEGMSTYPHLCLVSDFIQWPPTNQIQTLPVTDPSQRLQNFGPHLYLVSDFSQWPPTNQIQTLPVADPSQRLQNFGSKPCVAQRITKRGSGCLCGRKPTPCTYEISKACMAVGIH